MCVCVCVCVCVVNYIWTVIFLLSIFGLKTQTNFFLISVLLIFILVLQDFKKLSTLIISVNQIV